MNDILKNLDVISKYISLILFVLSIILTIVCALMKRSKNKKVQEIATTLEKATSNVVLLKAKIQEFMKQAEDFINYTGSDKKAWVVTKVKEFCIENSIAYDNEIIDSTIESLIEFSKRVNATEDKTVEVAKIDAVVENETAVEDPVVEEVVTTVPKKKKTDEKFGREIKING